MEPKIKKTINTLEPVKAWKLLQISRDGKWFTGCFMYRPLTPGEWQHAAYGPGFHAFKSKRGALRALTEMAREGIIKWPTAVAQVYLRGKVEFGLYRGRYKVIRGSHMLVKSKHIPPLRPNDVRFNARLEVLNAEA